MDDDDGIPRSLDMRFDAPKTLRAYYPSKAGVEVCSRRLMTGRLKGDVFVVAVERATPDRRGRHEVVVLDPRGVITDGEGRTFYNGRDWTAALGFDKELLAWLREHPSWPPLVLPPWPPDQLANFP